jgi:hypothetical protein
MSTAPSEVWVAAGDRAAAEPLVAAWEAEHHPQRTTAVDRFQYSMAAMLATMTAVVILAASLGREQEAFTAFTVTLLVLFFVAIGIMALRRRT